MSVRGGDSLDLSLTVGPAAPAGRDRPIAFRLTSRSADWGSEFGAFSLRRLPHTGNVSSLLESQEPSTVTDRIDAGGLKSGVPALFGALGASWTDNQFSFNGLNVTDPYLPGRPFVEPDTFLLASVQVTTGAHSAAFGSPGVSLRLATPDATPKFHGVTRWFFTGDRLQAENQDGRLERFGFPGPERFRYLADGSVELGGELPGRTLRWPVFAALSTQQLGRTLGGFAAPMDTRVYRAFAEISPLSRSRQRLNFFYGGQHVFESHEGANPRIEPRATTRRNDNFHQARLRADWNLSPRAWLSGGFGAAHAILSSGIQREVIAPGALDLPTMTRTGAARFSLAGTRTRYQADALLHAVAEDWAGSHSLSAGVGWQRSPAKNSWDALNGVEQILVEGTAEEVTLWNTPTTARLHVQELSAHVHDAWRLVRGISLPWGLRLDRSVGRARGAAHGMQWTTLQPRVALVMPLVRRGPNLRASWSRFGHLLQGRYLDFGNPGALGGMVFRWTDLSGDGLAQPSELSTRRRVFGGPHSALDRGLARPFTDEMSVGLDQDFGPGFRALVRFFRRDSHRLIALANIGVPPASYSPVEVLDPGNDGVSGNGDDQTLTLYDRNPAALGEDFLLLASPPGHRASFKGFEIRLVKPLRRLWQFSASFTAMRTLAATNPGNSVFENDIGYVGSLGTDPNTFVHATSRTYFDRAYIGKATGYYFAPRGFQLGFVAKYYDGLPFGRLLFVRGLNQGPSFVRATPRADPGGFRTQFNLTLDVRLAKEFSLGKSRFSGYLDFFNALNLNKNTLENDLTGPDFAQRVPLAIQSPRVARLGIEWRF